MGRLVAHDAEYENDHTNWPIRDVLEQYGWDGQVRGRPPWHSTRCPWHLDRNPSAGVSDAHNSFRCFSCDRAGNSVTLVMHEEGLDAAGAVEWLKARLGQDSGLPETPVRRKRANIPPWEPAYRPMRM